MNMSLWKACSALQLAEDAPVGVDSADSRERLCARHVGLGGGVRPLKEPDQVFMVDVVRVAASASNAAC